MTVMPRLQTKPNAVMDLRDQPGFSTVADHVWRACGGAGHPLEHVADHMQEMLDDRTLPFGLVAHDGNYLGSTLINVRIADLHRNPRPYSKTPIVAPQRPHDEGGKRQNRFSRERQRATARKSMLLLLEFQLIYATG